MPFSPVSVASITSSLYILFNLPPSTNMLKVERYYGVSKTVGPNEVNYNRTHQLAFREANDSDSSNFAFCFDIVDMTINIKYFVLK